MATWNPLKVHRIQQAACKIVRRDLVFKREGSCCSFRVGICVSQQPYDSCTAHTPDTVSRCTPLTKHGPECLPPSVWLHSKLLCGKHLRAGHDLMEPSPGHTAVQLPNVEKKMFPLCCCVPQSICCTYQTSPSTLYTRLRFSHLTMRKEVSTGRRPPFSHQIESNFIRLRS